jgi:hypothetical protein
MNLTCAAPFCLGAQRIAASGFDEVVGASAQFGADVDSQLCPIILHYRAYLRRRRNCAARHRSRRPSHAKPAAKRRWANPKPRPLPLNSLPPNQSQQNAQGPRSGRRADRRLDLKDTFERAVARDERSALRTPPWRAPLSTHPSEAPTQFRRRRSLAPIRCAFYCGVDEIECALDRAIDLSSIGRILT